jgi:hypothetical protein
MSIRILFSLFDASKCQMSSNRGDDVGASEDLY